jgi:hypothetical protein
MHVSPHTRLVPAHVALQLQVAIRQARHCALHLWRRHLAAKVGRELGKGGQRPMESAGRGKKGALMASETGQQGHTPADFARACTPIHQSGAGSGLRARYSA